MTALSPRGERARMGARWPMAVRHADPRDKAAARARAQSADETCARVWAQRERSESIITRERERARESARARVSMRRSSTRRS